MAVTRAPFIKGSHYFLRDWDASLRGVNADRGEYKEETDFAGSGLKACKSPEDRGDRRASNLIRGTNSGGGL